MSAASTNELLGYQAGARLLIVNADDFGMSHQGNAATIEAFQQGVLTSASLMIVCPWAPHAVQLLRENPGLPFGVHLTIVSEHDSMRWGPRASRDQVESLIDNEGYFFRNSQAPALLAQAQVDEVETEFRAQIDAVLATGLHPDHLDWHCLYDGGREDIFELTVSLAREYGLAIRTHTPEHAAALLRAGIPAVAGACWTAIPCQSAANSRRWRRCCAIYQPDFPNGQSTLDSATEKVRPWSRTAGAYENRISSS